MKISIITVCYNSEKYLEDAIKSVLNQTYKNIEYIIVDGNSKDNSLNIIKHYEPLFEGKMKWISEKDKGIYDAMNKGVNLATGDYIGLINSDDFLANNNVIENIVKEVINSNAEAIYGDLEFINPEENNKVVRVWKDIEYNEELIKKGWHPAHPTLYLKKDIYKKIGLFSLNYKIAADYDLMLRVFEKYKPKTKYINKVLVKMRVGGVSTSGIKSKVIIMKECSQAWERNGLKKPIFFDFIRLIRKIAQIR